MRDRTFRRVLMWDPHPLTRGQSRFWSNLQQVKTRSWRASTSYFGLSEAAQSLRKVSALVRAGLSAHEAWIQVSEGEEGLPYGVASNVLKQAGEHARMVTAVQSPVNWVLLCQRFWMLWHKTLMILSAFKRRDESLGLALLYQRRFSTYCHCWHC